MPADHRPLFFKLGKDFKVFFMDFAGFLIEFINESDMLLISQSIQLQVSLCHTEGILTAGSYF